jgi:hypothetical protein
MSSTEQQYNGWCNRETWLASLWVNNTRAGYELLCSVLEQKVSDFQKCEALKSLVREEFCYPDMGSNFWSDLLNTAWGRVNWLEVIENNADIA